MNLEKFYNNKKNLFLISLGTALLMFVITLFYFVRQPTPPAAALSQEEIADLVKPSVVRVVQHVTGSYKIPNLVIDLQNKKFSIVPNQFYQSASVDEYLTGSGFIVSSDGYILTNAHVISVETAKATFMDSALQADLGDQFSSIDSGQPIANSLEDFIQQIRNYLETNSQFNLQSQVVVLNPSTTQTAIKQLVDVGIPAKVIGLYQDFLDNEKDAGLIKIDLNNLPITTLQENSNPNVGDKIFVFGFPSTAEFNYLAPTESTFTDGIISAFKNSTNLNFKILQTNAKISEGSSGSPMLNSNGKVIGIMTYETDQLLRQNGDNFAFAVPINITDQLLSENHTNLSPDNFSGNFIAGLYFYHQQECQKAINKFNQATNVNYLFAVDKIVLPYVENCQNLIQQGKSLDSAPSIWKNRLESLNSLAWFVILGRTILVAFGLILVLWLLKKIRTDEKEITKIEQELKYDTHGALLHPILTTIPVPEPDVYKLNSNKNTTNLLLKTYILEAESLGLTKEKIIEDLKRAGWDDLTINSVIN